MFNNVLARIVRKNYAKIFQIFKNTENNQDCGFLKKIRPGTGIGQEIKNNQEKQKNTI